MPFKIKSGRIPGVPGKQFRKGGSSHYLVRIYLDADEIKKLDDIELVRYELHPTFRERIRYSEDRDRDFEITIWTYGYFKINAKLSMKDGSTQMVKGFVKW